MRIALFGGSGLTGQAIGAAALAAGWSVAAHVRQGSRIGSLPPGPALAVIEGPLDDGLIIPRAWPAA
jgi:uncharacterized protein YbjT (DUF2867 family)